ncbi:hypothetical protein HNY73_008514 [Argiope bruennichi]|uniref:Uncharacterized protein n=1 Tax=Argiope bruennichi TaxID=94029 RepID=A0A8T0F9I5_ARGBR|nr:hypothetical protein HNY73_008514 [Argiope bruennichi]
MCWAPTRAPATNPGTEDSNGLLKVVVSYSKNLQNRCAAATRRSFEIQVLPARTDLIIFEAGASRLDLISEMDLAYQVIY